MPDILFKSIRIFTICYNRFNRKCLEFFLNHSPVLAIFSRHKNIFELETIY